MSLWDTGQKTRYKQPAYGYTLGKLVLEVGLRLAEVRPGLFRFEYEEALERARSIMQSLVAAIPGEVLRRHGHDPDKLLDEIERMDRKQLLRLYHSLVDALDAEGLLIPKSKGQPREISSIDEE